MDINSYTFPCWNADYDFTQAVKSEANPVSSTSRRGRAVAVFLAFPPVPDLETPVRRHESMIDRIVLTCPANHVNVFLLPVPEGTPAGPIPGQHATPDDLFWQTSVQQMTPDKSTAVLKTQATWIFSTVGTLGTVLTGFTLLAGDRVLAAPLWLLVTTIALTSLSLVLAALALVPYFGRFDAANMTRVAKLWNYELMKRGLLVRVAGTLFALAFGAAGAVAIVVATEPVSLGGVSTLSLTGTGATEALSAEVDLSNLPSGATINTQIVGLKPDGTNATLLNDDSTADPTGSAKVTATIPDVSTFQQFTVTSTVSVNGTILPERTETATITP